MNSGIALTSLWIVACNLWHALLLWLHKHQDRPLTISEHAVENGRLLMIHRTIHSLPVILFLPLAVGYLLPNGHVLTGSLLLSAAVFDCIQTLSLNTRTAPLESELNLHSFTAWLMAISYMAYTFLISQIANVSPWIYGSMIAVCLLLLLFAVAGIGKRYFLTMQMGYFVLLSLAGLVAHLMLAVR